MNEIDPLVLDFINFLSWNIAEFDEVEETGNLNDFYDPEDADQQIDDIEASDIEAADYSDNLIEDSEDLVNFRASGCTKQNLANRIDLFKPVPRKLTRNSLRIGTVFGSGSGKVPSVKKHNTS